MHLLLKMMKVLRWIMIARMKMMMETHQECSDLSQLMSQTLRQIKRNCKAFSRMLAKMHQENNLKAKLTLLRPM